MELEGFTYQLPTLFAEAAIAVKEKSKSMSSMTLGSGAAFTSTIGTELSQSQLSINNSLIHAPSEGIQIEIDNDECGSNKRIEVESGTSSQEEVEEQQQQNSSGDIISIPKIKSNIRKQQRNAQSRKSVSKPFKFELILKNNWSSNSQCSISESNIEKRFFSSPKLRISPVLSSKNIFFLAGDILVELDDSADQQHVHSPLFNEFRNVVSIEQRESTVAVSIESISPIIRMEHVIKCLENSQNAPNYDFAQLLKVHQMRVTGLQRIIDYLTGNMPELELAQLLEARKKYREELFAQELARLSSLDEFSILGCMSLSFVNQTMTLTKLGFTNPTIAVAGANPEQMQMLFLRKGFLNQLTTSARRIIFSKSIEQRHSGQRNFSFEIKNFNVVTLDGIQIVCDCLVETNYITYPSHLHFQGLLISILNNVETLFSIKLLIQEEHIERILKIRTENIIALQNAESNKKPKASEFSEIKEHIEIISLEYAVISTEFLKKFYKNKSEAKVQGKRAPRVPINPFLKPQFNSC